MVTVRRRRSRGAVSTLPLFFVDSSSWFTAHKYSKTASGFVDLRKNTEIKDSIIEIVIPDKIKSAILDSLNVFGVNNQTIFPDIAGLCRHMNWEFTH